MGAHNLWLNIIQQTWLSYYRIVGLAWRGSMLVYPLFFMVFLPVLMGYHGIPGLAFDATLSDRYCSLVATSFTNDAVSNIVYYKKAEKNAMSEPCCIYLKEKENPIQIFKLLMLENYLKSYWNMLYTISTNIFKIIHFRIIQNKTKQKDYWEVSSCEHIPGLLQRLVYVLTLSLY